MQKIRVLVVDDSPTTRNCLVEVLRSDPELEVTGEAEDGKRAIELCRTLRPDVITLDMVLPIMSGVAITEYVMAYFPTPILIVSSSTNRGEQHKTYDALVAGAVDVFENTDRRRTGRCLGTRPYFNGENRFSRTRHYPYSRKTQLTVANWCQSGQCRNLRWCGAKTHHNDWRIDRRPCRDG
jgi:CheY-like chemotaxis protein